MMNNELSTVADLVRFLIAKKSVVAVVAFDFLEQPAIVVKVKLKFWTRLHCLLSGDYKDALQQFMQLEIDNLMPAEIPVTLILSV